MCETHRKTMGVTCTGGVHGLGYDWRAAHRNLRPPTSNAAASHLCGGGAPCTCHTARARCGSAGAAQRAPTPGDFCGRIVVSFQRQHYRHYRRSALQATGSVRRPRQWRRAAQPPASPSDQRTYMELFVMVSDFCGRGTSPVTAVLTFTMPVWKSFNGKLYTATRLPIVLASDALLHNCLWALSNDECSQACQVRCTRAGEFVTAT
jgi:hypothetical protein